MATSAEIRAAADDSIYKRLLGGAIQEYSTIDGRRLRRDPLKDMMSLSASYLERENAEAGGMVRFNTECISIP